MTILEDRLNQAAETTRGAIEGMPAVPPDSVRVRVRRQRAGYGMVAAFGALVLVLGTSLLIRSPASDEAAGETPGITGPATTETTTPGGIDTEPAVTDITHLVASADASSEFSDVFAAENLVDGDLGSTWQDDSQRGVGAWIELMFTEPVVIDHIVVIGDQDEESFLRNWKVQGYEIATGGPSGPVTGRLLNSREPQSVEVGSPETMWLRFDVLTTHLAEPVGPKPPFLELVLAEIQVFGYAATSPSTEVAPTDVTTTVTYPQVDDSSSSAPTQTLPVTAPELLVAGHFTGTVAPDLIACQVPDDEPAVPKRSGEYDDPAAHAGPDDALWAFLRASAVDKDRQGFASTGYVQWTLPDETVVFSQPSERDPSLSVTNISVNQTTGGWVVESWEGSGC